MPVVCSRCGAVLEEANAFCTKCGAPRTKASESGAGRRFCTACGAPLVSETKFCTACGAPAGFTPVAWGPAATSGTDSGKQSAPAPPSAGVVQTAAPQPGVPVTKSAAPVRKAAVMAVAAVVLFVVVIGAGIWYAVHRVRQKAHEIEAAYDVEKNLANLPADGRAGKNASGQNAQKQGAIPENASRPSSSAPAAPYGWTEKDGKLVPAPSPFLPVASPAPPSLIVPVPATGTPAHDWALKYERTENGPEADLVVRTGDINNLGFGWPQGFDPFSGESTPPHAFPWEPRVGAPDGTDRIMVASSLNPPADYPTHFLMLNDGYSGILKSCEGLQPPPGQICKERQQSMPQAIRLTVGALPPKINAVLLQIFADDFQAPVFGSHFQVSLNGTRIPSIEYVINALNQTGPIGKLVSVNLLPEYWPLLKSGEVKLLIDDPTTKQGDGYAVDFVRILVNPHKFKYQVSLTANVTDADKHTPIAGATVTAALESASTDRSGKCQFKGLPAGLVIATASAPGYDENSAQVDLPAGQTGHAEIQLHRHEESAAALEKSVAETGTATVYGIHFDTGSAKLRPDSMSALEAVLGLINNRPESRWIIAGHTDNQGSDQLNIPLSKARAASVISWLTAHGVASARLEPRGFGASQPVADNATANGRFLNRRVEISAAEKL
jgi:OmpA-OmpF porin, OOP family